MSKDNVFYTTAPRDYDYYYVTELDAHWGVTRSDKFVRKIEVSDMPRFETFQRPRYASGMHPVWTMDQLAEEISAKHVKEL